MPYRRAADTPRARTGTLLQHLLPVRTAHVRAAHRPLLPVRLHRLQRGHVRNSGGRMGMRRMPSRTHHGSGNRMKPVPRGRTPWRTPPGPRAAGAHPGAGRGTRTPGEDGPCTHRSGTVSRQRTMPRHALVRRGQKTERHADVPSYERFSFDRSAKASDRNGLTVSATPSEQVRRARGRYGRQRIRSTNRSTEKIHQGNDPRKSKGPSS